MKTDVVVTHVVAISFRVIAVNQRVVATVVVVSVYCVFIVVKVCVAVVDTPIVSNSY